MKRRFLAFTLLFGFVCVLSFVMIFLIHICFFSHGGKKDVNTIPPVTDSQVTEEVSPSEKDVFCVVVDAGHGGKDSGAVAGDVFEKDINLSVALSLKSVLEENGIEVLLTREDDEFLELSDRIGLANTQKADLFISLHCNSFEDSSVSGLECYYAADDNKSQKYAEKVIDAASEYDEIKVRSAREGEYHVLVNARVPSILVEMGFITSPDEREKLTDEDYQALICKCILDAIIKIKESYTSCS